MSSRLELKNKKAGSERGDLNTRGKLDCASRSLPAAELEPPFCFISRRVESRHSFHWPCRSGRTSYFFFSGGTEAMEQSDKRGTRGGR